MRPTLLILVAFGCLSCAGQEGPPASPRGSGTAPAGAAAGNPTPDESGDWIRAAKDFSSTRYSSLDQINTESVKGLGVRLTFSTGVNAGHEAAPLVVNNTMYIVTPWPNILSPWT